MSPLGTSASGRRCHPEPATLKKIKTRLSVAIALSGRDAEAGCFDN